MRLPWIANPILAELRIARDDLERITALFSSVAKRDPFVLALRAIDLRPPAAGPEVAIFMEVADASKIEEAEQVLEAYGVAVLASRLVR